MNVTIKYAFRTVLLTGASGLLSKLCEVLPLAPRSFIGNAVTRLSAARSEMQPRICSHDISCENMTSALFGISRATTKWLYYMLESKASLNQTYIHPYTHTIMHRRPLTDNTKCTSTWNATYATRIQSSQSGNSALFNFTAKNIVTTVKYLLQCQQCCM